MRRLIIVHAARPAADLIRTLETTIREFIGSGPQHDDLTAGGFSFLLPSACGCFFSSGRGLRVSNHHASQPFDQPLSRLRLPVITSERPHGHTSQTRAPNRAPKLRPAITKRRAHEYGRRIAFKAQRPKNAVLTSLQFFGDEPRRRGPSVDGGAVCGAGRTVAQRGPGPVRGGASPSGPRVGLPRWQERPVRARATPPARAFRKLASPLPPDLLPSEALRRAPDAGPTDHLLIAQAHRTLAAPGGCSRL